MELVKDGKLLGRTGMSWAKILGFYAVYYTFLACLIYFTVTYYADNLPNQPGGVPPTIQSRTDQPGAAVYPFQVISDQVDGDGALVLSTDINEEHSAEYIAGMDKFKAQYENNEDNSLCVNKGDVLVQTCKVPNAKVLSTAGNSIENSIKEKKPIFTLTVNKVYDWEPITTEAAEFTANDEKFFKNSIQAKCFECLADGTPVDDSKFNLSLKGEKCIKPNYYPYKGHDKNPEDTRIPYNKPFLIGQIDAADGIDINDAWKLEKDQVTKYFRCELFADNIERPLVGEHFYGAPAETKSWSNDLTKLGLGFVQFGLIYE